MTKVIETKPTLCLVSTVGAKGRITIPKSIRMSLGITSKCKVCISLINGKLIMRVIK